MAYNPSNSLTPMMFRKKQKKDAEGTRNERWRSRSVEDIFDSSVEGSPRQDRSKSTPFVSTPSPWKELEKLKGLAPVIACVIPSLSMDFVASSLLAVGATPIVVEGDKNFICRADNVTVCMNRNFNNCMSTCVC